MAIGRGPLRCGALAAYARNGGPVILDRDAWAAIVASNDTALELTPVRPLYGRSTGVGANRGLPVDGEHVREHALRLVRSHAGSAGPLVEPELLRAMLLVRLRQLAAGGAGVAPEVVSALAQALSADLLPLVRRYGGIGTGDLTALAATALCLAGEREWTPGPEHRDQAVPDAVTLGAGDALGLMSSNALTLGLAALAVADLRRLASASLVIGALSFPALRGDPDSSAEAVWGPAGGVSGVADVAAGLRALLAGASWTPAGIQDSYGLRGLPASLGPLVWALDEAAERVEEHVMAAEENPRIGAGGAQHHLRLLAIGLTLRLDAVRAALVPASGLALARLARLQDSAATGLRPFLAAGPQPSSGTMVLEYVAAAALAELRMTAAAAGTGAAVLSIGQEEAASFATQAAWAARSTVEPYTVVLACELVTVVRALRQSGRRPPPGTLLVAYEAAAAVLDADDADRDLTGDIATATALLPTLAAGS